MVVVSPLHGSSRLVLVLDDLIQLVLSFICALRRVCQLIYLFVDVSGRRYLDGILVCFPRVLEVLYDMVKVLLVCTSLASDPLLRIANLRVGRHAGAG